MGEYKRTECRNEQLDVKREYVDVNVVVGRMGLRFW